MSELALVAIRKTAELTTAAEVARARLLNGDPGINIEGLVKLENEARRAMRRLGVFGLKFARASTGPSPGLELARKRWDAAEKVKKGSPNE